MRLHGHYHQTTKSCKRALLTFALESAAGNRTRAARLLGINRTYLAALMRSLGLRELKSGDAPRP